MQEAELGKGFPGQRWPAAALPSRGSRAAHTPHHPKSTAWCGTRSRWEAGGEQGGRRGAGRLAELHVWCGRWGEAPPGLAVEATLGFAFGPRAEEL